jgi:hypothetical protein
MLSSKQVSTMRIVTDEDHWDLFEESFMTFLQAGLGMEPAEQPLQ